MPFPYFPQTRPFYNACSAYPCSNGGTCVPIYQAHVNPPYACVCLLAYTGTRCEQPLAHLNPCTSNPCKLGSTCLPNTAYNTYSCLCQPGYTGSTCNTYFSATTAAPNYFTIANNCFSSPCINGGTCTSSQFGYLCSCPSGFMGLRCDQPKSTVDLCPVNSCYNGGTCSTVSNYQADQYTVVCYCPVGYTGSRCQTLIRLIPTCQCVNSGLCRYDGSCQCQANYYGSRCEHYQFSNQVTVAPPPPAAIIQSPSSVANLCPAGLCVQGRCAQIPQGAAYYCICDWGWSGPRCNIRNYCQTYYAQCQNGAQCVNTQSGFQCVCGAVTTGQFCETGKLNHTKGVFLFCFIFDKN